MKDAAFSSARLLELYDRISDAEDAIPRLRRFVLDLAVRGKLVEQDAGDEPVRVGKLKALTKPLREVPSNWKALRLGDALNFQYGKGKKASERLDVGPVPVFGSNGIVGFSDEYLTEQSTIIIGRKGSVGALQLCEGPSWTTDVAYFVIAPDFFFLRFLLLTLQSLGLDNLGKGVKPGLSRADAYALEVHIPPLAEQHRIVAKVDELMALCDRLEQARAGREAVRDRLTTASLARLTAPETDAETVQSHALFALQSLPTLTTRPDQINTLRQTILNLAVRGKLVAKDPTDEPAASLLERAMAAKQCIRAERRISRSEDPEFSESACEASLPDHWVGAYLADFGLVLGGKRLPAGASFSAEPTDHIYIRVTDMKNGTILSDGLKYITPDVQKQIAKYTIDSDDIYITIAGTIGDVGDVPENFHGHNLTENAAKIVFREIDREFLILVLRSQDVQDQFTEKTKQMAQPKLALKRILGARLPLPPLAEQHRIVAKVEALMALCDQLEASLTTTATTRSKLLNALLHEALEPAADELEAAE